jgi:hypothetical protein
MLIEIKHLTADVNKMSELLVGIAYIYINQSEKKACKMTSLTNR